VTKLISTFSCIES